MVWWPRYNHELTRSISCFHCLCNEWGEMRCQIVPKEDTVSIPTTLPYATSQFSPRRISDRPLVVPKGSTNLALLGQFVEIPGDFVVLVDYSSRSAQIGVYGLLKVEKEVIPVYTGVHNPIQCASALRVFLQ